MGEVYLARDTRLARDVALKVLLAEVTNDPARLKRFENEARSASALNHPNIVTIYDVGTSDSVAWIAMEKVEGTSLRQAISSSALPMKKLLPIAIQIADGLAAAHEAGIVHRDLKPENVMLTRDDRVKILDFGLAKLAPAGSEGSGAAHMPNETGTFPGTVLGTVGYMSPEQAQGAPVDHRSDQFSFGSVLYEMATGKRAFRGKSAIDTLAAILNEDPMPVGELNPRAPVPLRWIIERCHAKEPDRRYTSTRDLARDLEALRDHSSEAVGIAAGRVLRPRRLRLWGLLTAAALLAGLFGAFLAGKRAGDRPISDFQRLTFHRGRVSSARFAPDGRTIVYSADFEGSPPGLFSTRTDGRDSNRLDQPEAELLSVSSQGELALSLGETLARVPLTGGAPREMIEGVRDADWSPDGQSLAVIRNVEGKSRLEYPIGKVLYEPRERIFDMYSVRVSPDGKRIAFLVSHAEGSDVSAEVVDLEGGHRVLSRRFMRAIRLAWSPDGGELWLTVNERGFRMLVCAITLKGEVRPLLRLPSWVFLQDVARDGRVLVTLSPQQTRIWARSPGDARERDLSWHDGSYAKDLTPDGKTLLFDEAGEGYFHAIYVRSMDGSPAKRIGEGRSMAISPDGRWVVSNVRDRGSDTVLLPTGAGEPVVLDSEGHHFADAVFFPDGKRIVFSQDDEPDFVKDLPNGKVRALSPGISACAAISPDGKEAVCNGPAGDRVRYAFDAGTYRPIPGLADVKGEVLKWSADGKSLFIGQFDALPLKIVRFDLAAGKTELWRELEPGETITPYEGLYYFTMTPDGKSYAYSSNSTPSDLYLVTGLR
jgi:Tol biopolymer transport system component